MNKLLKHKCDRQVNTLYTIVQPPKVIGTLIIHHIRYEVTEKQGWPNTWRRFWYWALLGWKWEKAKL
jgi:hypothetical protein